ncbi:hypothetical protein BC835DRAFT_811243 [Cytidiella melzeri]|nr:hypothetical protein BC835DRAFT_811243 [Cytidiella melzeri]
MTHGYVQVDALRGNVHELEKEKTRLLGQHQTDVDSLADLQSRLDQAHAHLGKLQDECRAAQADRAELETQLKDVQDTLAKRTNELESTSRELQSALFDLGQERNISGQLGAEKQVLQNTVEEQETAKQILRDEVDELKKDVERCRTELRTYDGILRLLEEQVSPHCLTFIDEVWLWELKFGASSGKLASL